MEKKVLYIIEFHTIEKFSTFPPTILKKEEKKENILI